MPELQSFQGRIVDLRRHVNVHWHHLHPIAPTDRYELWMRALGGTERKFTVHTREMPARRGHANSASSEVVQKLSSPKKFLCKND
jgi:hypothetical protein